MDEKNIEVYDSLEIAKREFGENYGAYVFTLARVQIEALLQERVVALDIDGEYTVFLVSDETTAKSEESARSII